MKIYYSRPYYFNWILITIVLLGFHQGEVLAQYSRIPVDRVKEGLKDSVKSVSAKIRYPYRDTVSKKDIRLKYRGWDVDLRGIREYKLYAPDGRFLIYEINRDSLKQPIDSMNKSRHVQVVKYDLKDYYEKQNYKVVYNYPSLVYNPSRVYLTKEEYSPLRRMKESNGYKFINKVFYRYEYIYDEKGEKILQDIKYVCFDFDKDGIVNSEDPMYITNYIYDNKDRVIRKDFDMSPLRDSTDGFRSFKLESIYDHTFLSVPVWDSSWQEFEYDDRDNVKRYSLKHGQGIKEYEDKYYYTDDNILYKIDRYYPRNERKYLGHPMATDRRILHYNEKGHLIKSEGIPHKTDTIAITRLYTYEYDERDNWTRCNIYLNGKLEEKPHVYIDRYIEYYNE